MTIAPIAYAIRTPHRPRYHANDHGRDTVVIDARPMTIEDTHAPTTLDGEGFTLVPHSSAVVDFCDRAAVGAIYTPEMEKLIQALTGADAVSVTPGGVLRFGERSDKAGTLNNSAPARFAHVDVSDMTAGAFSARSAPEGRAIARAAHYNIWRVISPPPQDVPLALCDARTVGIDDLIPADAVFDEAGKPEWSFEGLVVAHNPAHRWHWFADLDRDHAIIFKTHDSMPGVAHCVPHVAFDHPGTAPDWPVRASIEMRAIAYWFA